MKSHIYSILFAHITHALLFAAPHALALTPNQVEQALSQQKQWKYYENLGWQWQIQDNLGSPFKVRAKSPDPGTDCSSLCIVLDSSLDSLSPRLRKQIFSSKPLNKVDHNFHRRTFRNKLARLAQTTAADLGRKFSWPEDNVSALGTGFGGYFKKVLHTKEVVPLELQETYSSWTLKKGKDSSRAMGSLTGRAHTSGCQVALGSLVQSLLFRSYDPDVFGEFHQKIIINNAYFQPSTLLPQMNNDNSGLAKAKKGVDFLLGEAGYLQAIFAESVDNPDYFGENLMFTQMSEAARKELIAIGGLGHKAFTAEKLEDLYYTAEPGTLGTGRDERLNYFSGLSTQFIQLWLAVKATTKLSKKKYRSILKMLKKNNPGKLRGKSLAQFKKAQKIVQSALFQQTYIWGHPYGEQILADWIITLYEVNTKTPYSIYIYDYGLATVQWENHKKAHLK